MQADDRRLAGGIVDGDYVEPAGTFADATLRQEMPGGASQEMLFAGRDAQLGQGGHFVADGARADLDEGEGIAVVTDHIDFPF
jgi:hypothetical protein